MFLGRGGGRSMDQVGVRLKGSGDILTRDSMNFRSLLVYNDRT